MLPVFAMPLHLVPKLKCCYLCHKYHFNNKSKLRKIPCRFVGQILINLETSSILALLQTCWWPHMCDQRSMHLTFWWPFWPLMHAPHLWSSVWYGGLETHWSSLPDVGDGLLPDGTNILPEPMMISIHVSIWPQWVQSISRLVAEGRKVLSHEKFWSTSVIHLCTAKVTVIINAINVSVYFHMQIIQWQVIFAYEFAKVYFIYRPW